jgi:hypothetical protein
LRIYLPRSKKPYLIGNTFSFSDTPYTGHVKEERQMEKGTMIIIGPGADHLARASGVRALTFESVREFDLSRYEPATGALALTIEVDVRAALREIDRPLGDLDGIVLEVIGALCRRERVPTRVEEVIPRKMSKAPSSGVGAKPCRSRRSSFSNASDSASHAGFANSTAWSPRRRPIGPTTPRPGTWESPFAAGPIATPE